MFRDVYGIASLTHLKSVRRRRNAKKSPNRNLGTTYKITLMTFILVDVIPKRPTAFALGLFYFLNKTKAFIYLIPFYSTTFYSKTLYDYTY